MTKYPVKSSVLKRDLGKIKEKAHCTYVVCHFFRDSNLYIKVWLTFIGCVSDTHANHVQAVGRFENPGG